MRASPSTRSPRTATYPKSLADFRNKNVKIQYENRQFAVVVDLTPTPFTWRKEDGRATQPCHEAMATEKEELSPWEEDEISEPGSEFEYVEANADSYLQTKALHNSTLDESDADFVSVYTDLDAEAGKIQRLVRRRARSCSHGSSRETEVRCKAPREALSPIGGTEPDGPLSPFQQSCPFVIVSVLEDQALTIQRAVRMHQSHCKELAAARIQKVPVSKPMLGAAEELGSGAHRAESQRAKRPWSLFRHRRRLEKKENFRLTALVASPEATSSTRTPPSDPTHMQ